MNPEGNDQDFGPSVISTIEEGQATTCDDDSNGREHAVTVDSTLSGTSLDLSWSRSTIDTIPEPANGTAVFPIGGGLDTDRTPSWDPHETSVAVETTFGPSNEPSFEPSWPRSAASRREAVPDFEILGELGHGGMGIVYKARQVRLKRLVALKMIRDDWHGNPAQLARFEIEAEAVARLNHPNIVRIYEIGRAGRVPYVVLELLEGGTLKHRLAGTPQPVREAASLLATLARAVNAAHVADILHRDLKPSNVLFDQDGRPQDRRFRPGETAGGRGGRDSNRAGARHSELHGSRAGEGLGSRDRPGGGHLFARRDPLRDADRPSPFQGHDRVGNAQARPGRRAGSSVPPPPRSSRSIWRRSV